LRDAPNVEGSAEMERSKAGPRNSSIIYCDTEAGQIFLIGDIAILRSF
jgi:hypothetical protein